MHDLRPIDLNLLVVLETLLAERHVTRAARRLAMSQSAVSHALARLRALLGDELLVRGRGGLQPTARALELEPTLRRALALARQVVGVGAFEPATALRTFRLSMSDYGAMVVLPSLLPRLRALAPGVDLAVVQTSREEAARAVLDGELDAALGVFPGPPAPLRALRLFVERFVVVADRDHPAVAGPLTREAYLAAPHALVSVRPEASGEVETALASLGLARRVAVITPHFLVAARLIVGTDLLLTVAGRAVAEGLPDPRLVVRDPPFHIAPFDFSLLRHPRADDDPGLTWLIREIARATGGEPSAVAPPRP